MGWAWGAMQGRCCRRWWGKLEAAVLSSLLDRAATWARWVVRCTDYGDSFSGAAMCACLYRSMCVVWVV